jgi:hypothetical protein
MKRDRVPVNISVYRVKDEKLRDDFEGEDPVTPPNEVQALPGNKFTPRIPRVAETYYMAVRAHHPE